jgi:hypothetical protein
MEEQVSTRKESEQVRATHRLESADGGTRQDTERIQVSEGHSPTGERRRRDLSGYENNPIKQGGLTDWRAQVERQVRTQKQSE